jgi:hypothetical protein
MKNDLQHWQFSLGGMLLFTLSVAMGITSVSGCLKFYPIDIFCSLLALIQGILVIMVFWVVVGLLYQVRDLWVIPRSCKPLPVEILWGGRFAIFWRLAVIVLLVGLFCLEVLIYHKLWRFQERENIASISFPVFTFLEPLFLLAIVGSVPTISRRRRFSRWHTVIELVSLPFCLLLAVLLWQDISLTHFLEHIATLEVDASLRFSQIDYFRYPHDTVQFFWVTLAVSLVALGNLILCEKLARNWTLRWFRRGILLAVLIAGIVLVAVNDVKFFSRGWGKIMPYFTNPIGDVTLVGWIECGILVLFFVTMTTARNLSRDSLPHNLPVIDWRRHASRYYHEKHWFLILLAAVLALPILIVLIFILVTPQTWGMAGKWNSLLGLLSHPYFLLVNILLGVVLYKAFAKRPVVTDPLMSLPRFTLAQFSTVWMLTFLAFVAAVPVFMQMSIAY